jgi:hypothetical protein
MFHEIGIDQRQLNQLKNALFLSPLIVNNKTIPIEEWFRIKNQEVKELLDDIEP